MESEYPSPDHELKEAPAVAQPSRFIDEKISDESGTETSADSALKPAGLDNPFWN
jgi:hypothetical protein